MYHKISESRNFQKMTFSIDSLAKKVLTQPSHMTYTIAYGDRR